MKKKNAAALMAAAMAASLLVGCGGAASSETTSTAESKPAESTAESTAADTTADGDETLTVWAWDPNFNIYALKQAEAIYQKDHPNFKLNIEENVYSDIETKLITAATSEDYSTLPDIFLMQDYSFHKMVANFPGIYTELDNGGFNWDDFSGGIGRTHTSRSLSWPLPAGYCFPSSQFPIYCYSIIYPVLIVKPRKIRN